VSAPVRGNCWDPLQAVIAAIVAQEVEGPHAEAVFARVEVERVKVRHAGAVAGHELAIDNERPHAGQALEGIDHPTDAT
jgi:hypothetical protein